MIRDCKWVAFPVRSSHWASATDLIQSWKELFALSDVVEFTDLANYLSSPHNVRTLFLGCEKIEPDHLTKYLLSHIGAGTAPVNVFLPVIGHPVFAALSFSFLRENIMREGRNINFFLVSGSLTSAKVLKKFYNEGVIYFPFVPPRLNGEVTPVEKVSKTTQTILYAGRISHFKNVVTLLDLFAEYSATRPSVQLRIAGRPDNFGWPNITSGCYFNYTGEHFFEKLANLQSRDVQVTYLGGVTRAETLNEIAKADCITSLSTAPEEDFGLLLWEATVQNKAVVATKWGGFREFESLPNVNLVNVTKVERTLALEKAVLFQCWDKVLSETNSFLNMSESWRRSRETFLAEVSGSVSSENEAVFKKFKNYEKIDLNLEFYEHAENVYAPLWQ